MYGSGFPSQLVSGLKTEHRLWLFLIEGPSFSSQMSLSQKSWMPGLSLYWGQDLRSRVHSKTHRNLTKGLYFDMVTCLGSQLSGLAGPLYKCREKMNQKTSVRSEGGVEPLMDSYSQLAQNRDIYIFFVLKLLFIIVCEQ